MCFVLLNEYVGAFKNVGVHLNVVSVVHEPPQGIYVVVKINEYVEEGKVIGGGREIIVNFFLVLADDRAAGRILALEYLNFDVLKNIGEVVARHEEVLVFGAEVFVDAVSLHFLLVEVAEVLVLARHHFNGSLHLYLF